MVSAMEAQQQKELSARRRDVITGIRKKILKGSGTEMGKKHKKHKGDKHGHEGKKEARGASSSQYVEKPLKLVLKVGTGAVKELSTARAAALPQGFHESKADHDKHKDKKKKKKKKNEKVAGPSEEKKKKKEDKKKKEKSRPDSNQHGLHSPLRPDIPAVSVNDSSIAKPEEEQTPLQEALNQLVRQLQRKDSSSFFAFPVTDFIAPGYSMIIKNPMDFSTMKEKIRNNEYDSVEDLKENFKQICHNAMIYNKPGTIYFKAAKKLLNSGMKILSQERMQSLKQSIQFMADLQGGGKDKANPDSKGSMDKGEDQKEESMDISVAMFKTSAKDLKRRDKDQTDDRQRANDATSEKEQEQIDQIIRDSLGKLTRRVVNSQLEFERRKQDGTTTLALLNPGDTAPDPGVGTAILGSTAGRLQTGVNCLQGFKEDKRNKVSPVLYLNYGPFSSYAPSYDSTFANISKDDSDLIYTTYGEDTTHQGNFSLQQFLENTKRQPYGMVDCILDVFSGGEHSRRERSQYMAATSSAAKSKSDSASTADQLASLKSVFGLGLFEETFDSEEAEKFQRKLDETTRLLWELQEVQNERLSTKPPSNAVCLLAPSAKELQIADKVNENLKELTQQVHPSDIVSVSGIRKAMGIITPYLETEEMVVDLTADTKESEPLPKNGSELLQVVT